MVTCLDETRHGLEDGDFVTFTEVKGMEQLNGCEPRKVTVKGQSAFRYATILSADYQVHTLSALATPRVLVNTSLEVCSCRSRCPRSCNS
jgi:hypothetical protein